MEIYGIADSSGDYNESWGWFTIKTLAEKVLKIISMSQDEGAELITVSDCDLGVKEITEGLLPWMISAEVGPDGRPYNVHVDLHWPPYEEGLIEDREEYRRWFVWAKSTGEAIGRMAAVATKRYDPPPEVLPRTLSPIPLPEDEGDDEYA